MKNYDLIIIGGGPAGYHAASLSASAGLSVILFEKESIGGVCLNHGCIPTKSLLCSAKMLDHGRSAARYGLDIPQTGFDIAKIQNRKTRIIRKLSAGIRASLKEAGAEVLTQQAFIEGRRDEMFLVSSDQEQYQCRYLILATGSQCCMPAITGLALSGAWSSNLALEVSHIPERLLILGGGVIGMEFASFFNSMGSKVTVVEMLDEILGGIDKEIAAALRLEYEKRGVSFSLSTKVQSLTSSQAILEAGGQTQQIDFDNILVAAGRRAVTTGFGLENLSPAFDGALLHVEQDMQTSIPHLYACGDITGRSMLAHTAEREAEVAVANILASESHSAPQLMDYKAIPSVVYTNPEVACVGLTEDAARKAGLEYRVVKIPMSFAGRFVIENDGENGLCKMLTSPDGSVLGVHLLGNPSSEFILAATMAISCGIKLEQWVRTVFPHPTVSEILKAAALKSAVIKQ